MSHPETGRHDHEHHDHEHHDHDHHDHDHDRAPLARLRHLLRPHSHDTADQVDAALEASAEGMRTLWISLAVLGATACIQAAVTVRSGSVALLGDTPPAIVVYVDAWTRYGGSQFVDSPGTGRYHSYLCDEVVGYVDARYRTIPDAAHRAITGKSSGGFGAMITPMLRPDLFGALATHAGDALYEYSYIPAFPVVVRHLRKYDGDIFRWWDDFRSRVAFTQPEDMPLVALLGVAACFSATADGTPELPFDPVTGVLRPDVWQRWLDWDPVRMVPRYAAALRGLRGIWIDSGTRDDFYLDVGAAAFRAALLDAGVSEELIRFELFDATHAGIDYRYPLSLAWLCQRMAD